MPANVLLNIRTSIITIIFFPVLLAAPGNTQMHTKKHPLPAETLFTWPLEGAPDDPHIICDGFGPRLNFDLYDFHRGVDIAGEECETVVLASSSGTVRISADYDERYPNSGIIIQIQYPDLDNLEYRTNYIHLCDRWVEEGEEVQQGQPIGLLGITGAHWPHLHFEIRVGDTAQNPLSFLSYEKAEHSISIASVDTTNMPGTIDIFTEVSTPGEVLDINQVLVRVYDIGKGLEEIGAKYVNFNDYYNCGTDDECFVEDSTEICIDPINFWCYKETWDIGVSFSGFPAAKFVLVEAEATDCSGKTVKAYWSNISKLKLLPRQ